MSTDTPTQSLRFHDHGASGQEIPSSEDRSNWLNLPPMKRTKQRFTFFHPVGSWMHIAGYGWLPALKRLQHYPGLNGITRNPDGSANIKRALGALMDRGDLILDAQRFRVEGQDYCVRHRCMDGGWHYTSRWVSFVAIGGKTRTKSDPAGQRAWVSGLVDEGLIDPMPHEVLGDKVKQVDTEIKRLERDSRIGSAFVQRGLEEARAKRGAMTADWDRQFGAEPTKPTKATKARGAKA